MRVYISGKIGEKRISPETRRKFQQAADMLEARGFKVFNPTTEAWQKAVKQAYGEERRRESPRIDGTFPDFYTYTLLRDLMALASKDAIYMPPDFIDSPGAKAEHAFAIAAGKQVYYDEELFHDGTLRGAGYNKHRLPEEAPK